MNATSCCLCNQATDEDAITYRVEYFGWDDTFAICYECSMKILDGNASGRWLHRDTAAALAAALLIDRPEAIANMNRLFPNMASFSKWYAGQSAR